MTPCAGLLLNYLIADESLPSMIDQMGRPQEIATEFMAQVHLVHAGFWRLSVAFIIDLVIVILIAGLLALTAIALTNLIPQNPTGLGYATSTLIILGVIGFGIGALGTILAYFPVLEGRFGQTPGKSLLNLRVLTENGLPIGYKQAFLRRLSFYFEMLLVDALFIPFTEKRQRGFDTSPAQSLSESSQIPNRSIKLLSNWQIVILCGLVSIRCTRLKSS